MRNYLRALFACGVLLPAGLAGAHGFVGDRFFPPTIATDDPFATDELLLPSVSYFTNPASDGSPATKEYDFGFEFDKEIFPRFTLGVADQYIWQRPVGQAALVGWDQVSLSAKYQLWQNDPHEAIISIGIEADIGGTGGKNVSDSFTTYTPIFYFGKGFGDLPDSMRFAQPLAVTGTIGQTFPTQASDPNALQWGFAVEYSLLYLNQRVEDVGMPRPFRDMVPLVEFSMNTPENRGSTLTTGTINPGVLWEMPYGQLGAEAQIPVNRHSGPHVGVIVQVEIYIDDIFPKVFGHPIFGEDQ